MKCKKCGEEKTAAQMAKYAGEPTDICKACRWGKGPAPSSKVEVVVTPPAPLPQVQPSTMPTECVVHASLGFCARVDGDSLVISQANSSRENDDDNITLTRQEAKRLFDTFGEWIVAS